jgi:hypothetical protein
MVSRTLFRPILDQKFGSSLVFIWPLRSWDPGPGSLHSYFEQDWPCVVIEGAASS